MTITLTPKGVAYLGTEEGMVREAYKDTKGIWTWALGVTDASGHLVGRYKDNPAPLDQCLAVSVWLIKERYLPAVDRAFTVDLNEAQTAAALSFHWNTGAIGKAQWVKDFNAGRREAAYENIMQWSAKGLLTERRKRERRLFFNEQWPGDLRVNIYPVNHDNYHPVISKAERVDLIPDLKKVMHG